MRWEPRASVFGWRFGIIAIDWLKVYHYNVGTLYVELHPLRWAWGTRPRDQHAWCLLLGPIHLDWQRTRMMGGRAGVS